MKLVQLVMLALWDLKGNKEIKASLEHQELPVKRETLDPLDLLDQKDQEVQVVQLE